MGNKAKKVKLFLEVDQNTIRKSKENFERAEKEIINKLYFKASHRCTIRGLNHLIMRLNNLMLFPRIEYAEIFNRNGNEEVYKNE